MSGYRVEKLAADVRWIVSDVIRNKLNDPRIAPMSSVTRVELSGDLQVAKVYISVYGAEADGRRTLAALNHARGHIQRIVARHLHTRHCPEIRLHYDDSLKRANETLDIIERTMREQHGGRWDAVDPEVPTVDDVPEEDRTAE